MLCLRLALLLLMVSPVGVLAEPAARERLRSISRWGYQLQHADVGEIAASPFDLVVIDYSRDGTESGRFSAGDLAAMKAMPGGGVRLVLAYLSIGEAEDYRYYWSKDWVEPAPLRWPKDGVPPVDAPETVRVPRLIAPGWLGRENERWKGNYHVRFWYDAWQELIMHDSDSYLSRIIAAGFDGVYLDRVDVYYAIERDVPGSRHWMINFVEELATIARRRKPGFLVLPQNAEELLLEQRYLAAIDGVAKEDLLYGSWGDGRRNATERIEGSAAKLALARAAGLTVLAVEYLDAPAVIGSAAGELRSLGMVPYFGPRRLDRLVKPDAEAQPPSRPPAP